MFSSRNLLSGKRKYLWGLILLLFISVTCVAFGITGNSQSGPEWELNPFR